MPVPDSRAIPAAPARGVFPIRRAPAAPARPVLVSVPHYGTDAIPGIVDDDYRSPRLRSFRFGYTDPFAREIYGRVHEAGATLLATPYSRLFVDVNRARGDFELHRGEVRSRRGVIRTHVRDDAPVFRRPLGAAAAERMLTRFYDPYHRALREELRRLCGDFGHAVLLDAHTASGPRIRAHEVVIGTRRGATCSAALADGLAGVVREHGFECRFDVPGYVGGHIVRTYGAREGAVQAVQLEFNALRIMRVERGEFVAAVSRGTLPAHDRAALERCAACVRDAVAWLGRRRSAHAALPAGGAG